MQKIFKWSIGYTLYVIIVHYTVHFYTVYSIARLLVPARCSLLSFGLDGDIAEIPHIWEQFHAKYSVYLIYFFRKICHQLIAILINVVLLYSFVHSPVSSFVLFPSSPPLLLLNSFPPLLRYVSCTLSLHSRVSSLVLFPSSPPLILLYSSLQTPVRFLVLFLSTSPLLLLYSFPRLPH